MATVQLQWACKLLCPSVHINMRTTNDGKCMTVSVRTLAATCLNPRISSHTDLLLWQIEATVCTEHGGTLSRYVRHSLSKTNSTQNVWDPKWNGSDMIRLISLPKTCPKHPTWLCEGHAIHVAPNVSQTSRAKFDALREAELWMTRQCLVTHAVVQQPQTTKC